MGQFFSTTGDAQIKKVFLIRPQNALVVLIGAPYYFEFLIFSLEIIHRCSFKITFSILDDILDETSTVPFVFTQPHQRDRLLAYITFALQNLSFKNHSCYQINGGGRQPLLCSTGGLV